MLTVASTIRLFSRTQGAADTVEKQKKTKVLNRMRMSEEPKATMTHNVNHPNTLQRGMCKAIKDNPQ